MKKQAIIVMMGFISFKSTCQVSNEINIGSVSKNDSIIALIHSFSSDYSKIINSWSPEKKEWFNDTFVHSRGNFSIPKEPLKPWKD
jgi:hypothetical protein